jgi:hydroxypyruvate isomerase
MAVLTFAPNISWLFPELPFKERARAAAEAGFKAVEFGFPSACDISGLAEVQAEYGLEIALFNQDVPVWDANNRGYLADPGRRDEFKQTLDDAIKIVELLGVHKVMLPVGVELPGMTRETQRGCVIENLQYASSLAEQANVLLTIEVLNPIDNPGYFLTSSAEGFDIVRIVNHPQVKFQFDTYHLQLMEGNLTQNLVGHIDLIGHIQFADVPGRHEPGTGELNFLNLSEAIIEAGYEGTIGLEYIPLAQGKAALDWLANLQRK